MHYSVTLLVQLLFLFKNGIASEGENQPPTIATPLGVIEGHIGHTVTKKTFFKFEGVPYAKPPIGDLRFEPPQEVEPWTGTWKANVLTRCLQNDHFTTDEKRNHVVHGDEDCLYLNIYTNTTDPTSKLDVLVFIHGGCFNFGRGASYGPEIIMNRNVVYVNINYRLGPLGFLSTEDEVLPGNVGLRDQTKALKWIKSNIHLFGGNPDSITTMGLSAGGASVHLHYLLPASRGLFTRGMSQSGCALNQWILVENIKEKTAKLADLVGCPTSTSEVIKTCLKTKPARMIVQSMKTFQPFLYNPCAPLAVVVDGQWSKDPVLPDHPYNLISQGKVYDAPWMVSYTKEEGLYPVSDIWADDQYISDVDTKWNEIMPFLLHYNETAHPAQKDQISQTIRKHYLGDQPLNRDTYPKLVDIASDRLFISGIDIAAKLQNQATKSYVYSYYFSYRGATSHSTAKAESDVDLGVSHGDDTIYTINTEFDTQTTDKDRAMSTDLLDLVTSFMNSGTPNITSKWEPFPKPESDLYYQLHISGPGQFQMEHKKEIGQRSFWDSLPLKEINDLRKEMPKDEL